MAKNRIKPKTRPKCPNFSSGPSAKRPGWSLKALSNALVGRSHRSYPAKRKLQEVIDRTRKILGIPVDYRIGIVPASDTGAMEMAIWSMLGCRGIDALAWESFGQEWVYDIETQLQIPNVRTLTSPYGDLPDLRNVDFDRDVVFTWNGTTSGVRIPDGEWISPARTGLTLCDATSAAFGMHLPWDKLDVVTWSWQKVLGGEGAHGMVVVSPRAIERLLQYTPPWPLPKILRVTNEGSLIDGIFAGETINTPSMIAVEDALDGLKWAASIGGLPELIRRCEANLATVSGWQENSEWASFLAKDGLRSCTSLCLRIHHSDVEALSVAQQRSMIDSMTTMLEHERVAYDIASYRSAPPGLRLWGGATVENEDIEAVLPWLDWAFAQTRHAGQV
ncbi:phosphoserine transaminase [Brucella tritici]|uniref:phosphoserine transaminase n=1 Tax=Brucella tritici TaxID=94626 RepID=A0A6L3YMY1_9HYPH|nr:phosphoserine transaminase [Brucella tritici]KAB2684367.1 phosphoserine transaminase [Brucella tritici]